MCPISFAIYEIKLNKVHFSSGTTIIHVLDQLYQETNFKSHLNSEKSGKICQICTCPIWLYFTLLDFVYFYNEIRKFQL